MAPKTRATTERKGGKRKKKERTSFTDDLNPFSPLVQPPLQPSLPSRLPTPTPPLLELQGHRSQRSYLKGSINNRDDADDEY